MFAYRKCCVYRKRRMMAATLEEALEMASLGAEVAREVFQARDPEDLMRKVAAYRAARREDGARTGIPEVTVALCMVFGSAWWFCERQGVRMKDEADGRLVFVLGEEGDRSLTIEEVANFIELGARMARLVDVDPTIVPALDFPGVAESLAAALASRAIAQLWYPGVAVTALFAFLTAWKRCVEEALGVAEVGGRRTLVIDKRTREKENRRVPRVGEPDGNNPRPRMSGPGIGG